eukprot:6434108-Amphidinium_carterae.1
MRTRTSTAALQRVSPPPTSPTQIQPYLRLVLRLVRVPLLHDPNVMPCSANFTQRTAVSLGCGAFVGMRSYASLPHRKPSLAMHLEHNSSTVPDIMSRSILQQCQDRSVLWQLFRSAIA